MSASADPASWPLAEAGALRDLVADPAVTDIVVNGPAGVWVDRGRGLQQVAIELGDAARVRALAVRLAAIAGRRLDDAAPAVDAPLPGGVRMHAILPPLAPDGPLISLRVARRVAFTLTELTRLGALSEEVAHLVLRLVAGRANLVVSGATGTGKTTLLSALLGHVAPNERIVVIEEARELSADHPHVVRLEARNANVEGQGAVSLAELVRHALRMRPDRLVLGECRGAEVREVLAALNTGHEGSFTTVHANTASDVPARLAALGALAAMSPAALAAQAGAGLDAIVHLTRRREDGQRHVAQISALRLDDAGGLIALPACTVEDTGLGRGPGWPALAGRFGW